MRKLYGEIKKNIYMEYTVLFIAFGIVIFSAVLARHNSFVAAGDCFNQYYPVLGYLAKYYREFIPNLLHGHIAMYDTSIGFGDDIIGVLSYYGFEDIFTIPAAFFPEAYISYAYTLIMVLKIYLSGITFLVYAGYRKFQGKGALTGALLYCFSFYLIGIGLTAFSFNTAAVYFPLLIYGIDYLRNYRGTAKAAVCKTLVITVFLQSLCGFYFIYMGIIGCMIYFLVCEIADLISKKENLKGFLQHCWRVVWHFGTGMGMAGILLIPVIMEYLQCMRLGDSSNPFASLFGFPATEELATLIRNLITPSKSGYEVGLSTTVMVVICLIYLLKNWKQNRWGRLAVLTVIGLWGYFGQTVGTVMSGFAYNTNRWTYMLYFLLSCIVAAVLPVLSEKINIKDMICFCIAMLLWIFSVLVFNDFSKELVLRLVEYLVIWMFSIYALYQICVYHSAEWKKNLYLISIFNIVMAGFLLFAPVKIGGSGLGASFKGMNFVDSEIRTSKLAQSAENTADTNTFERYDLNDTSLDSPAMMGINTTYLYYSMCNGSIYNIFNELRISPAIMHTFTLQGLDARQVLESIMSTGTYAVNTDRFDTAENKYVLPIGFTSENGIAAGQAADLDPLQKMDLMMSGIIIESANQGAVEESSADISELLADSLQQKIPVTVSYGDGITRNGNVLKVSEGAQIHIQFDPSAVQNQPGTELYLYLRNLTSDPSFKADVTLAGKLIRMRAKKDMWYFYNNFDYLVQVQNAATTGKIDVTFQDAGEYTLDGIELVQNSVGNFETKYQKLNAETLQNVNWSQNEFTGMISLQKGKWMFFSLPYSKGWSCRIDGVSTKVVRADYSFMAVNIPEGQHEIEMAYCTPGIRTGALVSILMVLVFISVVAYVKKAGENENGRG